MEEEKPGLFVAELIKETRSPGSTVEDVFKRTRMDVLRGSHGKQAPWYSSTLEEEFIFSAPVDRPPVAQARTDPAPPAAKPQVSPPPAPAKPESMDDKIATPAPPATAPKPVTPVNPRRRAGRIDQAVGCPNSRQSERCRGHLRARTDLCEEQELFRRHQRLR